MIRRISKIAPYGSLLKAAKPTKEKTPPFQRPKQRRKSARVARDHDDKHLAAIRRCPCLACDIDPAGVAAHLRMSGHGKPVTGIGIKPDDRYALPLCRDCHTHGTEAQHRVGEPRFWSGIGLDPFVIAARLYEASPDVPAMRAICFAERESRK